MHPSLHAECTRTRVLAGYSRTPPAQRPGYPRGRSGLPLPAQHPCWFAGLPGGPYGRHESLAGHARTDNCQLRTSIALTTVVTVTRAPAESELKASQDTAQWTIKQNKNTLLALKQVGVEMLGLTGQCGVKSM